MRQIYRDIGALALVVIGVVAILVAAVALFVRGDWPLALAALGVVAAPLGVVLGYHEPEPTRPTPGA